MKCPKDVVAIFVKLITRNGHLPQGSPCSSYMAYYSYLDMWEQINSLVDDEKCILSVYADDITISGKRIPSKLIYKIKSIIKLHGFGLRDEKEVGVINKPADITGIIVRKEKLFLPNRQFKKLFELNQVRKLTGNGKTGQKVDRQIAGRMAQKRQVERANFQ